eukprot:1188024-Prorocentrum_minimum.AAC.2
MERATRSKSSSDTSCASASSPSSRGRVRCSDASSPASRCPLMFRASSMPCAHVQQSTGSGVMRRTGGGVMRRLLRLSSLTRFKRFRSSDRFGGLRRQVATLRQLASCGQPRLQLDARRSTPGRFVHARASQRPPTRSGCAP